MQATQSKEAAIKNAWHLLVPGAPRSKKQFENHAVQNTSGRVSHHLSYVAKDYETSETRELYASRNHKASEILDIYEAKGKEASE
jgi:hypothetical protein